MSKYIFSSYGLLFGCPFQLEHPNCHLIELRKLPILKRLKQLQKMSPQELMEIEIHHKECLQSREKKYKKKPSQL